MDILLAHAFFLRFDPKQWASMQPYAPLGTLFAASYLRQQGYRVGLFDSMLARGPDDLISVLEQHRPKMVVFHEDNFNWLSKMCLTRMREACFEMMKHVKKHLGAGIPVVVAGSDATDHQELYFEKGADYVIIGESEQTLTELANYLLGHSPAPLEQIAGLALKTGHTIHRTAPRGFIKNLDLLPMPAWDLIDIERYRQAWRRKHGYYSINLVTTRGCPFKCNWCAKPIYGNRYNCRSPENVVEEMVWLKRHVQPDHIWFADDIFGLKPGWVEHFGELVEAAGVVIPYKIQARVDLLSEEVVQGLKKSGCKTVWVGAESGSQKILDAMEKGTTVEQIYAATRRLRRHGIEVCFFLQFGYPGESDEEIEKTLQMVRECQPDDIGISVSYPLPGTKFYETVKNAMGPK
ncbi:MAG: radical SAM protein, partial [Calditrichaeota bacterium]